jgi:carbon-monoxide dehydrogenase small subunit
MNAPSTPAPDEADVLHDVQLTVNGARHDASVPARRLLSDFLRHDLRLSGTHVGCEHGVCGACTVLLDGAPVRSCLLLAVQADGREVTTVEGLAGDGELSALQRAFVDHGAVQCGFCTAGLLVSATALLRRNPWPSDEELIEALAGNLCRCTGYSKVVAAVRAAANGHGGGAG